MIRLNTFQIIPDIFPDKTSQVWNLHDYMIIYPNPFHFIEWDFESEDELIHLNQLVYLLKSNKQNLKPIHLYLPYLPYGRQDKWASNKTTFAFYPFANLLNSMEFDLVSILDPHCSIFSINKSFEIKPFEHLRYAINKFKPDQICFPDESSARRYSELISSITHEEMAAPSFSMPVQFLKIRDHLTGNIISYELERWVHINKKENEGKKILIVDDICDGGSTFVKCATKLREIGFEKIGLYVTHGLFTKGFCELKKAGISEFYSKKGKHDV